MLTENTDPTLLARCERISRNCALAVAGLGIAVLIGWALDVTALKAGLGQWQTMKPNTALGFMIAGVSLFAAGRVREVPRWRVVQLGLGGALILLGLLTVGEYLFAAADFGIDRLLFRDIGDAANAAPPGRMPFATATGFVFTGLALVVIDNTHARATSCIAALVGGLTGVLALMGYAFGVEALYRADSDSSIALHTAIGLVIVNLGILHARPQRRPMAVLTSTTVGGVMTRRLLPLAVTAPFLIGWLCVRGEAAGLYGSRSGIALVSLTYVVLFGAFVWHTGEVLRHADLRRLAAERGRRQQQAQLSGIIDSARDAIVMLDAAHRIVLFNPAAEQMFGRCAAEMLGAPLDALLPERFRSAHFDHVRVFGTSAGNTRRDALGTIRGLRANGEEFPIEASIFRVEVGGDHYLTAIVRDVTDSRRVLAARRESEKRERLRSEDITKLLDAVPAAVWFAHDPQATVITGNKLSYQWLDLPEGVNISRSIPVSERQGNYRVLSNGVDIPPAEMPVHRAAAGAEVRDFEFQVLYGDGSSRYLLGNATPLLDDDGRSRGAISAFVDITARREAELAMQAAKSEAERANNAKSRFLAAASHDLRQPLSALALYTSVLDDKLAPADRPVVVNMKACVGSLSGLLTDLLDLSKLEAGVVRPNRCTFPVAEMLANLLSVHAPEADRKGLRLHCRSSSWMAHTDPVLFKRILGNLVDNAVRYTDRGGVLVACRRRQGRTWIEVRDTGIGIAADKTAEIFEEFRQLGDEARTRGSGLGLAIVAKTAALLGLEIRLRSRPGRGSLFAIELPLGHARASPAPEPDEFAYRPLRIALVEDNTLVRDALAAALRNVGHQVVAASGGTELCARLGTMKPEIVVSDFRLARGETGFDVITAVRTALNADVPAILITGDTDPALMRRMADRGIAVLHKPVDLETLQAYLEDLTYEDEAAAVDCARTSR